MTGQSSLRICFLSLGLLVVVLFACKSDPMAHTKKDFKLSNGHYQVEKSFRNGKVTSSLDNGFYAISGDTVTTNLTKTLDTISTIVKLNGGVLKHKDQSAIDFHVSEMTSDTLILDAKMRNFNFNIVLVKTVQNEG